MSIWRLMVLVAIVAINCAFFVPTFKVKGWVGIAPVLPTLILQWGVFRFLQRGEDRRFWIGYLILGGMVTGSFLWAIYIPEVYGMASTGGLQIKPGSFPYQIWRQYTDAVMDQVLTPLFGPVARMNSSRMLVICRVLIWLGPQILAGLLGGLVGQFLMPSIRHRVSAMDSTGPVEGR